MATKCSAPLSAIPTHTVLQTPTAASMQRALRHVHMAGVAAPSAVSVVSLKLSVSWSPSLISCFVRACKLTSCWITAFTYHTCQHTAHNRQLLTHVFTFYLPPRWLHYTYMLGEIKGFCLGTFPLFSSTVLTNKCSNHSSSWKKIEKLHASRNVCWHTQ